MVPSCTGRARMPRVSLSRLWTFLAVALPILAAVIAPMSTVDLAYHLRAGSEILTTGRVPMVDHWTFTAPGSPWLDQQWGAQVILAAVFEAGGWSGLVLLRAALTGLIVGAAALLGRRAGLDQRAAALLALGAFVVAAPAMALRPQLLGMALFLAVLIVAIGPLRRSSAVWLVPALTLVWANIHGSFVLAPAVLLLIAIPRLIERNPQGRTLLAVAALAALAACLTPYGPAVWGYAVGLSADREVAGRITEWQATSVRTVTGSAFFASLALVVVFLARRPRRTPASVLLWLASFAGLALYAERGVAWWPFAAIAVIAPLLAEGRPAPSRVDTAVARRLNAIVAVAAAATILVVLPHWRGVDPRTEAPSGVLTEAPSGLTDALRDRVVPGARVLNPQPWGSWLEFTVPEALYAVDSRIEVLPAEVWRDFEAVMAGSGRADSVVSRWEPDLVLLSSEQGASTAWFTSRGWVVAYEDPDGFLLVPAP